ncbi:MAG: prepilin-type N-terminal cleavage/methylation domain-containing protein [Parcubacteria group bacterium]|nr:prepilin-type N-terminal cleavage/methylation domain-containing protein [Parcubacteria group bacterium]
MQGITTHQSNRGVSLIEAVIYVAIFAMVFAIVVNTVVVLSDLHGKTKAKKEVLTETRLGIERMLQEIRFAQSIDVAASSFGVDPGTLKVNTTIASDDDTPVTRTFFLQNGSLVIREGPSTDIPLTSGITISRLVFYNSTQATTSAVHFEVTAEVGSGVRRAERAFEGGAVLRRSY